MRSYRSMQLLRPCILDMTVWRGYGSSLTAGLPLLSSSYTYEADLTRVMDPTTSKTRGYDLTFAGIYPIWTCTGVPTAPSFSPSSSVRSSSTLVSDLPPVQTSARETVKQGSTAWSSLRAHQLLPPPSPIPSFRKKKPTEAIDPGYVSAIQAINSRRTDLSHPGAPGKHQLPRMTEREGARRMILSLCGERTDRAGEIHR